MSTPLGNMQDMLGQANPGAMAALGGGLDSAADATRKPGEPTQQEIADVKSWWEKLKEARDFDEPARKQYAKDRKYARGDSGFAVDTNLIGTSIDILFAFLYAQNPDVEAQPSPSVEPPSLDALMDAAMDAMADDPRVQQAAAGAHDAAVHQNQMMANAAVNQPVPAAPGSPPGMPGPPPNPNAQMDPNVAAQAAAEQKQTELAQQQFKQLQRAYEKRQRQNKAFADTIDIVIERLWFDARLKKRARRVVKGALTVGPGWLKASWQTRTAPDPNTVEAMNDIKAQMERAAATKLEIEDIGSASDAQALQADLERQLAALAAKTEITLARGFVTDFVEAENMIVPQDCGPLSEYLDSPWLADQCFLRKSEAMARHGLTAKQMEKAVQYTQRPPVLNEAESGTQATIAADGADQFTTGAVNGQNNGGAVGSGSKDYFVKAVEIWDKDSGSVLTTIEGIDGWVKPSWNPKATTRWYPYFLEAMSEIDGQRHPQSLTSRLHKLADEYNSVRSGSKEHRTRVRPKSVFNEGMLDDTTVKKLANGQTAEFVGVNPTVPGTPLDQLVVSLKYPAYDAALYDTKDVRTEMEQISGVQEALSQGIQTVKTATEANIQNTGFQTRTGSMRDTLDDMLTELALYTAEVALANMSVEDAQAIAGPNAIWIPELSPDDLKSLVGVRIKAGSSGKPNLAHEGQIWSQMLPQLMPMIENIAKLRNSDPEEIASRLEEVVRETMKFANLAGSTDRFIPRPGARPPGPPPIGPVEQSEIHMNDCLAMQAVANAIKAVPAMAITPKLGDPDAPPADPNGPVGVMVKSMIANQSADAAAKAPASQDVPANKAKIAVANINAKSKVMVAREKPAPAAKPPTGN